MPPHEHAFWTRDHADLVSRALTRGTRAVADELADSPDESALPVAGDAGVRVLDLVHGAGDGARR